MKKLMLNLSTQFQNWN